MDIEQENTKKVFIKVPESLFNLFKAATASEYETVSSAVRRLMFAYVKQHPFTIARDIKQTGSVDGWATYEPASDWRIEH